MLTELRVLDLSTGMGLMCGHLLHQLGADVRQWVAPDTLEVLGASAHWQAYTRGKTLEPVAWRLAPDRLRAALGSADVLIEPDDSAALPALGLGPEVIAAQYPRLIRVAVSAFGATGVKAGYHATDLIATAASGHLYVSGADGEPPVRISCPQAGAHASADAAVGVLIALADRERTGLGQRVDASAQQSSTLALLSRALDAALGQDKAHRAAYASAIGNVRLRSQFQARDGWVVVLQGVLPPLAAFMERLMAWVHEAGFCQAQHLDFDWGQAAVAMAQGQITAADWDPVQVGIERLLAGLTKAEIMQQALARRVLVAPVFSVGEILESEHLRARGVVRGQGAERHLAPFVHLAKADPAAPGARRPASAAPAPAALKPLAGLKVLDLFWVVAGPGATRMLADYGATVVHVESTRRLDMVRNVPPYIGGVPDPERAGCHHTTNANKLNITLDLGTPAGRAVLKDLVGWADVFTESFAPGVVARMGFDYPSVQAWKPDIIMISSCLMGQSGPWSAYAGYGNSAAAVTGFHGLTGHPGRPPTGCFGPYTDFTSVRLNALAILTAWMHKQRTGEGQYIDMAQSEAALHFLAPECHRYFTTGEVSEPCGNRDVQFAPQGVYPAAGNDRWIAISVQSDAAWAALCQLLGWSALGDLSLAERHQRHDELDERLASWCSTQDGLRLEQLLQQHGVAAHRVMDTHDLYSDAQLQHRGHYLSVHHRDYAPAVVESSRLSFSRTAAQRPERAPWFGCDNETVLREVLGYDAQQLASLVDGGVLR